MKKLLTILFMLLIAASLLTACRDNSEERVTCTICNGLGQVKYYYGEGDNDFTMGPCTSCDEKGYIIVTPSGDSNGGKKVVCGSCEKYVDKVITKDDKAGETRTWCAECWKSYNDIMGQ